MTHGLRAGSSLDAAQFRDFRRRAIFECGKWDPRVGDTEVLAPFPVILKRSVWKQLAAWAEALALEVLTAEEMILRSALPRRLGSFLTRTGFTRLAHPQLRDFISWGGNDLDWDPLSAPCRVVRFDFHPTTGGGWCISEANTDVPGGYLEASAVSALMQEHHHNYALPGDPAGALAEMMAASGGTSCVALVHATAYTDDRQVMEYLARRLRSKDVQAHPVSPAHVEWSPRPHLNGDGPRAEVSHLFRFYPAEWLFGLPRKMQPKRYAHPAGVPQTNPATALLTQVKSFPLLWEALSCDMSTWRALLPETQPLHKVPRHELGEDWLLKPCYGRVGDGIVMRGVTQEKEARKALFWARLFPQNWVAQRRFEAATFEHDGQPWWPCLGVYTVAGRAAGCYLRLATKPLVDAEARDAALLIED